MKAAEAARTPAQGGDPRGADPRIAVLRESIARMVKGKDGIIELVVTALLAQGHVLLEDLPGVGKTTLAQALAKSLDASFRRIQFTSDLLPSDILGVSIWRETERRFELISGPIFHHVILADEINRASPKTQSALLEAMSEGQVSIESETRPLPRPFFVIATQNPFEPHGTFPLPESQLDRFLMRLSMGYPESNEERDILKETLGHPDWSTLKTVLKSNDVVQLQEAAAAVTVEDSVLDYIVRLANATRKDARLTQGISPRGSLALKRTAQALALVRGRRFVIPDDIQAVAKPVMLHRLIARDPRQKPADLVLDELIKNTPVPR